MKWRESLERTLENVQRWFRKDGKRVLANGRAANPKRKDPETEGERALYEAMGWNDPK